MANKFAPTYRSLESSNYFFGSYMTNGRQRVKKNFYMGYKLQLQYNIYRLVFTI